ncbi:hypothetical protein BUALT_Bualt06G0025600 [Buddleja alternifolia]|uniref:Myb/SANT-like domain-containing protein n=1 Tax=Buddleja alternifolia TaxID=168488 RepID=A0AAV6XCF2_9LAMI|nr:hypothetical protein BUALT_Bualt06G0025600 [Buddleja alternifolia]
MEFDPPNGRRRGKGSKHVRTPEEDESLINCMLELKEKGIYNTEGGGFKHGIFKELKRMLQIKLPGRGLKDNPHIQSRYKLLKRQYEHFYDLRVAGQGSGFGWDDNRKCLTASTEEEENDSNTETMDDLDDNKPPTSKRTNGESSKQRPRKREKSIDGLMSGLSNIAEMMGNHLKESREQMSNIINVIAAPEQQNMDNRQKLNEELRKISTLSLSERYKVGSLLVHDKDLLDYFFTVEDYGKEVFVRDLLQDQGK